MSQCRRSLLTISLLWAAAGCGPSMDTAEATAVCERLRVEACFDDQALSDCIACHQECGRECSQLDGCRPQFTCD